nr:LPS export ABC transporter periplasmic protein LptC [uncultured Porphyromonas sp.]
MLDLPSPRANGKQLGLPTEDHQPSVGGLFRSPLAPLLQTALALLAILAIAACSKERVETKSLNVNIDSLYTARMIKLNTLISDSGMIRYRMIAPVLLIYERPERNEWVFPQGLILRPYDTVSGNKVFIKADSAIRSTATEEWELIGHVQVQGPEGQRLNTHRLFWQRDQRRLYSHDTTYFFTQGRELRGSSFEATDDLSWYQILNNKGMIEYDEEGTTQPAPSPTTVTSRPDSLQKAPSK